jgi:hypothetical protein
MTSQRHSAQADPVSCAMSWWKGPNCTWPLRLSMSQTMKRSLQILFFVVMLFLAYQGLGWLGVLLLIGAGLLGGIAGIPINRKVREDERKACVRREI